MSEFYGKSNLALQGIIPNRIDIKSLSFSKSLIHWYSESKRDLPWRQTKDPYRIWLSEIILQQTRVNQGLPYYQHFVEAFPAIQDLAAAPQDQVLSLWQGLGYYSRARNLHAAAKQVVHDFGGDFPNTYADILKLKGVGPYTAAAISSICYDEPQPVVDGNVFRVASRVFGIYNDISEQRSRNVFVEQLKEVIPEDQPGTFNQAMMECGAVICKPNPSCNICPVREYCFAFEKKCQTELPVKSKKLKPKGRNIQYAVYWNGEQMLMKKREGKDIWQGLYDFPEHNSSLGPRLFSQTIKHQLTHQSLQLSFDLIKLDGEDWEKMRRTESVEAFTLKQTLNLPKPKPVVDFIKNFNEHLQNDNT